MKGAIIILKIRDVFKAVENAQKMELFFDSGQQVDETFDWSLLFDEEDEDSFNEFEGLSNTDEEEEDSTPIVVSYDDEDGLPKTSSPFAAVLVLSTLGSFAFLTHFLTKKEE